MKSHYPRRRFLARAGALAGLVLGGGVPPIFSGNAWAQDSELLKFVDTLIGVDIHSHAGGVHFRTREWKFNLADKMKEGRIAAVCYGHTGDGPALGRDGENRIISRSVAPGLLWQHTLERLDLVDYIVRSQGLRRVLRRGELEQAHRERSPAIVQMIEGSHFLEGRLERIAEVHRRGVRQLQLVHFMPSELGDHQTEPPVHGGLTAIGREAIVECNRLGMVIDTAHATMQVVEQAAKVAKGPLILSHTHFARQPGPTSRLVSAEHGKLIAATGGVVGVWTVAYSANTLAEYVERVARMVDAIGVDHVAISSDVGGVGRNLWTDYAAFPEIVRLMRAQGFGATDVAKIVGGNYVRVFNAIC